jgi:hypothetical protein
MPLSGEGFCGPKVVVVVLVDVVVVDEVEDEVVAATVVDTGGRVVIAVEVVLVSLSLPLQAASSRHREAASRAGLE